MNLKSISDKIESAVNSELARGAELAHINFVIWRNGQEKLKIGPIGAIFIAACTKDGQEKNFTIPSNWTKVVADYLEVDENMINLFLSGFNDNASSPWCKLFSPDESEMYNLGAYWRDKIPVNPIKSKHEQVLHELSEIEFSLRRNICNLSYRLGGSDDTFLTLIQHFKAVGYKF